MESRLPFLSALAVIALMALLGIVSMAPLETITDPSPTKARNTAPVMAGEALLTGTVTVIDLAGEERRGESGTIWVWVSNRCRSVEVDKGAWSIQVSEGTSLSPSHGIMEGHAVRIDGTSRPSPDGGLHLAAHRLAPPTLHVVADDTGRALEDLEVIETLPGEPPHLRHPHAHRDYRVLARAAASPLDVDELRGPPEPELLWRGPKPPDLFVRAPGYAWARVTPPARGQHPTLRLERTGALEVTLCGGGLEYPSRHPMALRLSPQGARAACCTMPIETGVARLDALAPGDYRIGVEIGPVPRATLIGSGRATIVSGETMQLALELEDPPENIPVALTGLVVLPAGAAAGPSGVQLYRMEPLPRSHHAYAAGLMPDPVASSAEEEALLFSLPAVIPAKYWVRLGSIGSIHEVEVAGDGPNEVRIEVPSEALPAASVVAVSSAEPTPRTSCLILTEGIRGGIIAPSRHRRVAFSYDWNEGVYRAVDRSPGSVRTARLSEQTFEEILDEVTRLGLPDLPLEEPRGTDDVYGLNKGVLFCRDGRSWENRAPGGCVYRQSKVVPTVDDLQAFRSVVDFIEETLAALPMESATFLDEPVAILEDEQRERAFLAAVDHLRRDPLSDEIDLNRFLVEDTSFWFTFRGAQHLADRMPQNWPGYVKVVVSQGGGRRVERWPPPERYLTGGERREAFVDSHPELTANQKELILTGWVEEGMTREMVLAAWGEPNWSDSGHLAYNWAYGSRSLTFSGGTLVRFWGAPVR